MIAPVNPSIAEALAGRQKCIQFQLLQKSSPDLHDDSALLTGGGDSGVCLQVFCALVTAVSAPQPEVMQWEHVVHMGPLTVDGLFIFERKKTCMWRLLLLCPLPILMSYREQFKKVWFLSAYRTLFTYSCGLNRTRFIFSLFLRFCFLAFAPLAY